MLYSFYNIQDRLSLIEIASPSRITEFSAFTTESRGSAFYKIIVVEIRNVTRHSPKFNFLRSTKHINQLISKMTLQYAHLRVARPTDNLEALLPFYRDGLGFKLLLRFDKHEGFDGMMLGHKKAGYHLEFTSSDTHKAGKAPTPDNLLIFYLPEQVSYEEAIKRMEGHGFSPIASFNPYWDRCGKTYEDPDGYRVVLANMDVPV